jgi:prepilin-type N-terminal cleavage/methylation domain-containing protein
MLSEKGFTLIEVLVVVVVIAIIALIAFPSYLKSRITAQNDAARVRLLELANAARMYNEGAKGKFRVAGDLAGNKLSDDFADPRLLFGRTEDDASGAFKYLTPRVWHEKDGAYSFSGYTYYVCNPDVSADSLQSDASNCKSGNEAFGRIATMKGPADEGNMYKGFWWWVSVDNLGIIGSNYGE